MNGAEPVSPATIARFTTRFAKYGIDVVDNKLVVTPSFPVRDGSRFTVLSLGQYLVHDLVHHVHDVTGERAD